MAESKLSLVVMAGGSGTRFWPKSTSKKPKQLLAFANDPNAPTLLNQTLSRFDGMIGESDRYIVTTTLLSDAIMKLAPTVNTMAEPQARNTAPCVYWAARVIAEKNPDSIMLVMPADHYIPRLDAFRETVARAVAWASAHDDLVTLGVKPNRPETGYGYLRLDHALKSSEVESDQALKLKAFVEKPSLEKAIQFVESGEYLWNGGMFVWKARTVLAAFDKYMPEMKKAWEKEGGKINDAYPLMPATSIDYGIMEKASNVVTFPLDCGWDDLGSWTSLESVADVLKARHEAGVVTAGEVISVESSANIIDVPGKCVALLGIEDLIIVEAGQALLIARKDRAQDIKLIVDQIKQKRPELA